jgi:4'-phosphopantetheinyl transferase
MAAVLIPLTDSISIPSLSRRDVHVWSCDLSGQGCDRAALASLLSPDEQQRAARFAFEKDRRRFILSHGWLRVILSRYVAEAPAQIQFETGMHGKPAVHRGSDGEPPIEFSLSHSGHYALVAVANGRAVGVDVEICRPDVDALKLAERFFAPLESERIAQAHGEEQARLFYRYWTGKEAYLKGRGVGLTLGLDRFELLFDDGLTGATVRSTESGSLDRDWSVQSLQIDQHVASAIAIEGGACCVQMFTAPPVFR